MIDFTQELVVLQKSPPAVLVDLVSCEGTGRTTGSWMHTSEEM